MSKKPIQHPNLFDYLDQINLKKRKYPYDKKIASAYMITLWLSHDPNLINIVQDINKVLFTLPDDVIYEYFMDRVPKRKRFIRWTKKIPLTKKQEKRIEELQEKYGISKKEARIYLDCVR